MLLALLVPSAFAADLPLKHVDYEIDVAGPVADVTVRQTFVNDSDDFVEATYVFPLQPDAAVDDLVMRVEDREIRGEVRERDQARKEYEQARAEGRTAALTEEERPNVFTQTVANLPPHAEIEVEVHVVQPVRRADGQWELDVPLVVGPRFTTEATEDAARITPPLSPDDTGLRVGIEATLHTGLRLASIDSPTHQPKIRRTRDGAYVRLDDVPATRDFVLRWDTGSDRPQAAALREGDHVLLWLDAPDAPPRDEVVPREIDWVIDTSCSMSGEPLDLAKRAMDEAFDGMDARDSFLVYDFEDDASSMSPYPLSATPENLRAGRDYVQAFQGSGGTNLLAGIEASLNRPVDGDRERYVVFLTDGYIGDEQQILGRIEDVRGPAHVFVMGLGSSTNRYLLDEMSRAGRGRTTYVTLDEDPADAVDAFLSGISKPVLSDISLDWQGQQAEAYPGALPDLVAGQPLWVTAAVPRDVTSVTVHGRLGDGTFDRTIPIVDLGDDEHAIGTLWARDRIADLERQQHWGEIPEVKQAIVDTALDWQIVTKYTSFVAVDRKVVNPDGRYRHVDQAVDTPDGVVYEAVVSREFTPPGDPLLTVDAPEDARSVVVFYPWGQRAVMRWDEHRRRWYHRFLVPRDVADGDYAVQIWVLGADGEVKRTTKTIHVDGAAPEIAVDVLAVASTTKVVVHPEEPLRSVQVQPVGHPELRVRQDLPEDVDEVVLTLPGTWPSVEVVAKDRAMNTIVVHRDLAEDHVEDRVGAR